jgi:hypothetical protein
MPAGGASPSAAPEPEPEPKPQPAPERPRGPRVDPEGDEHADAELAALRDRLAKLEERLSRK